MKTLILVAISLFISSFLTAQYQPVYPYDVNYTEFDYIGVRGDYLVTSGNCNTVRYSDDKGQTWSDTQVDGYVRAFSVTPEEIGNYALLSTTVLTRLNLDDGELVEGLSAVYAFEYYEGKILTSFSKALCAVDPATLTVTDTIYKFAEGENDYISCMSVQEDLILAGTRRGKIIEINLTTKESTIKQETDLWLRDMQMISKTKGYIGHSSGSPLYTEDGWDSVGEGLYTLSLPFFVVNEDLIVGYHARYTSVVTTSNPNGMEADYSGNNGSLIRGAASDEDGNIYFVGTGGFVGKSEDYGQTLQSLTYDFDQKSFDFLDIRNDHVVTGGEGVDLLISDDGGQSWSPSSTDLGDYDVEYIESVKIIEEGHYLIATGKGLFDLNEGVVKRLVERNFVDMSSSDDGETLAMLVGEQGGYTVTTSNDGGLSWDDIFSLSTYTRLHQSRDGTIYVPADSVYHVSSDDGETWETFDSPVSGIKTVEHVDENTRIYVTSRELFISTDGGMSAESRFAGYSIRNLIVVRPDHYIVTTDQNGDTNFFESKDNDRFSRLFVYCVRTNEMKLNGDDQVVMVNRYGYIHISDRLTANNTNSVVSANVEIYPNPVLGGLSVEVDFLEGEATFYSLDGRSLYRTAFNDSSISTPVLSEGLYLLSIQTEEGQHTAKIYIK